MTLHRQDGRLNTGVAVILGMFALALMMTSFLGVWRPWGSGSHLFGFLGHNPGFPFYGLLSIWGLIQIGLAVWVGYDANRRGHHGPLWGLLVFVTGIVGLIVYLLVAPQLGQKSNGLPFVGSVRHCPGCRQEVQPDFRLCPQCGTSLGCKQCDKPLEPGWKVCPYCGTSPESAD